MSKIKSDKKNIQEAHIYFPLELYNEVKELAQKERRTLNGQVLLMIEKFLSESKNLQE